MDIRLTRGINVPNQDLYFKSKPLYDVLTLIDRSIREAIEDTGFGDLVVEFTSSHDPNQFRVTVRNTAHHFYQVNAEDMQQLLNSGPHFPDSYVSAELWEMLGNRFHIIFGEGGSGYGHICLSTEKGKHQQIFKVVGGVSHKIRVDYEDLNLED